MTVYLTSQSSVSELVAIGAAQAIPGPLFTFAAFLGAIGRGVPSGPGGAALATLAIFLPFFLLVGAALPLWGKLRTFAPMRQRYPFSPAPGARNSYSISICH